MGAFSGDGSFYFDENYYHYRIRIHLNSKTDYDYGKYLLNLIQDNFQVKVRLYTYGPSTLILTMYSKILYTMINENLIIKNKTENIALRERVCNYSTIFLYRFARGCYDTDGHVKKDGRVVIKLISSRLIQQLREILLLANIPSKVYIPKVRSNERQTYELNFFKNYNKLYYDSIGFSNSKKLERLKKYMRRAGFSH